MINTVSKILNDFHWLSLCQSKQLKIGGQRDRQTDTQDQDKVAPQLKKITQVWHFNLTC